MYQIYGLINPLTGQLFYVGYTSRLESRIVAHFNEKARAGRAKKKIIKSIKLRYGDRWVVGVEIFYSNLTKQEALQREVEVIAQFGRTDLGTGILANATNGGDGGETEGSWRKGHKQSKEARDKIQRALKGRRKNQSWKDNIGIGLGRFYKSNFSRLKGRKQDKILIEKRVRRPKIFIHDATSGDLICKFRSRVALASLLNKSKNNVRASSVKKRYILSINGRRVYLKYDASYIRAQV